MYSVIVLQDGTFYRMVKPVVGAPTPETANVFSTRGEAQACLDTLRKEGAPVWSGVDPIVGYDAARFPVAKLAARIKELEAAAKKDPYTVAAVDKGRQMEIKMGELCQQLQAAVEGRTAAEVSANRLRIERDDLARKLNRR